MTLTFDLWKIELQKHVILVYLKVIRYTYSLKTLGSFVFSYDADKQTNKQKALNPHRPTSIVHVTRECIDGMDQYMPTIT